MKTRKVQEQYLADPHNDKIEKVIELNAPLSRVWKAVTDYEEFEHWFRVKLDQPFEARAVSTGRMTYPGHEGVPWFAYIERMEPASVFTFRWYDSNKTSLQQLKDEPSFLVEFNLEEIPGGTRLTISESGFSALPEARRIELMQNNTEGWNIQAKNLAEYLSR